MVLLLSMTGDDFRRRWDPVEGALRGTEPGLCEASAFGLKQRKLRKAGGGRRGG